MLHLLLTVLFSFNISSSLVLDPSYDPPVVGPRQFWAYKKDGNRNNSLTIKYALDDKFDGMDKRYIREQFEKLTSQTCLKSLEITDGSCRVNCARFISIEEPSSCRTYLMGSLREVHLPYHCFTDQWVLHEILHLIGFAHEHQRSDRDCYVQVLGAGLTDPEYKKNNKIDISFPYDVHSIMHYRRGERIRSAEFSYNQWEDFGSYDELTEMDTIAINYLYCGGPHYCDINPERCQYFRCWIECNPCSDEPISQCRNCTGNTYEL